MLKTFKGKLVFGTLIITSIANLILTFYISKNLNLNLQNRIERDMNNIKIMAVNNIKFNTKLIVGEDSKDIPWKTISDINNNFKCFVAMANKESEILDYSGKLYYEEQMIAIIKESESSKSLLKLNKKDNLYIATYNYPIYIDGEFYTNLIIQDNYTDDYSNKNKTLTFIIIGQGALLILLSLAISKMINKMTTPLKKLSVNMKNFGLGKDVENIIINSNDEIEDISNSFNNMKCEIENQIEVITKEKERVLELEKISKEFFNNATHELKTPITAISGYAQVLSENLEMQDEFTERALERTIKECEKMKVLVQNILDISRGNYNKEDKVTIKLKTLIEEIVKNMEVRLIRLNLLIKLEVEDVNIEIVKSDIEQILINLIDNSIKYTKGNIIEITLRSYKAGFKFKIRNSCSKIPDTIKDNLLEPFVKYNIHKDGQKGQITSSGLGLYLCSEIAKRNNVKLNYEFINEQIVFELLS